MFNLLKQNENNKKNKILGRRRDIISRQTGGAAPKYVALVSHATLVLLQSCCMRQV